MTARPALNEMATVFRVRRVGRPWSCRPAASPPLLPFLRAAAQLLLPFARLEDCADRRSAWSAQWRRVRDSAWRSIFDVTRILQGLCFCVSRPAVMLPLKRSWLPPKIERHVSRLASDRLEVNIKHQDFPRAATSAVVYTFLAKFLHLLWPKQRRRGHRAALHSGSSGQLQPRTTSSRVVRLTTF